MSTEEGYGPDLVADLLRAAGRREAPPADTYTQTLEAATAAWRRKVGLRRRRRYVGWAAACLIAAGAAGVLIEDLLPGDTIVVARVERAIGTVETRRARDDTWATVSDRADALSEGSHLRTASGLAGILLAGDASLRMAEGTEIVFVSPSRVE